MSEEEPVAAADTAERQRSMVSAPKPRLSWTTVTHAESPGVTEQTDRHSWKENAWEGGVRVGTPDVARRRGWPLKSLHSNPDAGDQTRSVLGGGGGGGCNHGC